MASKPARRHSQDIAKNNKVSAAVAIKFPEHPVVGISVEGDAQVSVPTEGFKIYDDKFHLSDDLKKSLLDGSSPDKLYCLKPRFIALHDEVNFPHSPRQEWLIRDSHTG